MLRLRTECTDLHSTVDTLRDHFEKIFSEIYPVTKGRSYQSPQMTWSCVINHVTRHQSCDASSIMWHVINHVTRHQSCDASSIMRCLWYFRLSIELMCSAAFVDAFGSSFERNILIHQTMYNGILKLSISVTGCISWTILPWRIYRLLAFSDLSGVEKRGHVDPTPGYVLTFYLVQLIFIVYLKYLELCTLSSWADVV